MSAQEPSSDGSQQEASSSGSNAVVPAGGGGSADMIARVQQQLASLVSAPRGKQVKQRYAFWETQPVVQFSDTNAEVRVCCGGGGVSCTCARAHAAAAAAAVAAVARVAAELGSLPPRACRLSKQTHTRSPLPPKK